MGILRRTANRFWSWVAKFSGWRPNPDTKSKLEYFAAILAVLTGVYGVYEIAMKNPAELRTQQETPRTSQETQRLVQQFLAQQQNGPSHPGQAEAVTVTSAKAKEKAALQATAARDAAAYRHLGAIAHTADPKEARAAYAKAVELDPGRHGEPTAPGRAPG